MWKLNITAAEHAVSAGNCGNGPNMVILPEGVTLRHVATTADMADVLAWQLKVDIPQSLVKATEVWQAIRLHGVVMLYQPLSASAGVTLALHGLVCMLHSWTWVLCYM